MSILLDNRKKYFIVFILVLIISNIIIATIDYDDIVHKSKYDFVSYQKMSKSFIGLDTDISKRDWQYPPIYSILIIPTLFFDENDYLIFLNIIISVLSMYFLFLFCRLFISEKKAMLISFITVLIIPSFSVIKIGMPISLSSLLFIIFCYNLYKIKTNFVYCAMSFVLLILTKYLFVALTPCLIYWIYKNYNKNQIILLLKFFILPIIITAIWFIRNLFVNGFNMGGMLGGYEHINLNIYLIPSKLIYSITDSQAIYIMLIYLLFLITYIIILRYSDYINPKYMSLCNVMIIYFILTMFMFGFLYNCNGLRIRYFIYQTPILFMLTCLNIKIIDDITSKLTK